VGDAESPPVIVSIVSTCIERRDPRPFPLGEPTIRSKTFVAEHRRVCVGRTEERVPARAQFPLEETARERFGLWLGLLAGVEVDLLQAPKNVA
jgi:hypothetical protein